MWKKFDTSESRSTSFPHITRNLNHDRKRPIHFAQSTTYSPSKNNNDERTIDTESMTYSPRRTPSLTMALLKLHDAFDNFCNHIQDATCSNAQAACLIFDSSVASSHPSSPSISGSPSSQRSSSPSRSPTITSWFVGSYNSELGSSQKSEWSTLINPLIIFAGLEANYSACTHMKSYEQSNNLIRLYERTIIDLSCSKNILCEPFIYSTNEDSLLVPGSNIVLSYIEKATTIAQSIDAIMSICECRCKLITIQKNLASSEKLDIEKNVGSFQTILTNLPNQAAKSTPIIQNISQEVKCWYNIMKIYLSLEKLRFMDTIVWCQKTKMNLNLSSNTTIQKWMSNIYQSLISVLPIYFDWVDSDVVPRDKFRSRTRSGDSKFKSDQSLEGKVKEFLEKRIGNPLAIAVVFSEHGPSVIGKENSFIANQCLVQTENVISAFRTIYMRSTINQNSPNKKVMGTRRNSGKKDIVIDNILEKDTNSHINFRVENDSWPYTSWTSLVPYLKGTCSSVSEDDSAEKQWSQIDSDTSLYIESINNVMWLLVMRKTSDENRWNRRTGEERGKEEEKFFTEFSTALRLREIFKTMLEMSHLEFDLLVGETLKQEGLMVDNDNSRSQLLESIKGELGLRSPSIKSSTYSIALRKRNAKKKLRPVKRPTTKTNNSSSHYAFFLGSHLMNSLNG